MFEENEWLELVMALISATRANALVWTEQDHSAVTTAGESSYEIGSVDADDRIPYFLSVRLSENGIVKEIARMESEPLDNEREWTAAERLVELRNLAFRSARGAPQIFGKLLTELKNVTGDDAPF